MEQIGEQKLTERERAIAEYVVGNIDENGWLTRNGEQMVDDLAFRLGIEITDAEMERVLEMVRSLDPPGVGASDLRDCLLIQLRRRPRTAANQMATRVIDKFFTDFHKRHFERIRQRLDVTEEEMKEVLTEISRLNPKPGNSFGGTVYENNGNQIAVTNVFVLYVRVALADDNYRTDYFFEEGGSGYYICDGKIINVTWTKTDVHEPIKVYNEDGEEVEVNRGKSYICLVRSSNADKTTINP